MNLIRRFLRQKKIFIAIELLVLAGALWYFFFKGNGKEFETATVSRGEVKEELILSGEIKAQKHARLSFQSSGTVAWVGVKEGDWVKKGQALLKLDTQSLNSSLQRARSDLRDADATVARVHDDLKNKGNSESFTEKETRTTAEVAKDKAYEAVLQAEKALKDATLIAPFEGFVTNLVTNSTGINVTAAVVQIEIVNPETLYLSVNADQTEISHFKVGDKTDIVFDAFEEEENEGVVETIAFAPIDGESGTVYPIRIKPSFTNEAYKYKVGMTADARFILRKVQDVLYVPSNFVKSDKEGKYVLTDAGKKKLYITQGLEGEERIEISGDVREGTTVYDD